MNIFRITCLFTLLLGIVVFAEAVLPKWAYPCVFIACGVAALWVVGTMDNEKLTAEKQDSNQAKETKRSEHDYWTGVCYRWGDFIKPSELVRMGGGSKPDKHFHSWCWSK